MQTIRMGAYIRDFACLGEGFKSRDYKVRRNREPRIYNDDAQALQRTSHVRLGPEADIIIRPHPQAEERIADGRNRPIAFARLGAHMDIQSPPVTIASLHTRGIRATRAELRGRTYAS